MFVWAIVCEYNPFHNGHQYQIKKIRECGATHIVAIMSGNFTQRGIPSIISKHTKAEIALKNGCDLIIELPTPYCVANAEKFAYGAIFLADALNCIDFLSFGCENDNINDLQKLADISNSSDVISLAKEYLKNGISFSSARCNAIETLFGKHFSKLISKPNNILAIEYIKNLKLLNSTIKPIPILRNGCQHNGNLIYENFASSSILRNMILKNNKDIKKFIPEKAYQILSKEFDNGFAPANIFNCERAILSKLRCMSQNDFLQILDVSEGLENKIYKSVQNSVSLNEIYSKIKSKRYTLLRIQRIILSAFLGITKDFFNYSPPYLKILGFNDRGKDILKIAKNKSTLPIVTNNSDIKKLNNNSSAIKFLEIENHSYNLYNLMLPNIKPCGSELTNQIIKI